MESKKLKILRQALIKAQRIGRVEKFDQEAFIGELKRKFIH
ncbi:type II toxin-antitoxin system ParD family antitoxin [Dyadobacter arcticus]